MPDLVRSIVIEGTPTLYAGRLTRIVLEKDEAPARPANESGRLRLVFHGPGMIPAQLPHGHPASGPSNGNA